MLKKIGLDEECFDIRAENGETLARITVPVEATRIETLSKLTDEIVKQITTLPQFPDNIVTVQKLLADPKSEMVDIARHISTDPAMTADLLKLVNSAQFMLPKRVDNIVDAVKLVGLKGIRNQLYSYGALKILGDESDTKKRLWEHSYRCAYYAYNLPSELQARTRALDDAYVGGLLDDMGKIFIFPRHPDLLDRIRSFARKRTYPFRHRGHRGGHETTRRSGARIAEKWISPNPCGFRTTVSPRTALMTTAFQGRRLCGISGQRVLRVSKTTA
jgi:HD-like signal output (HDOD) protein